jgi:hypothetical protein
LLAVLLELTLELSVVVVEQVAIVHLSAVRVLVAAVLPNRP